MTKNIILSPQEVCAYTSLSRSTINRKREIGDFPTAIRLSGKRIGFWRNEIDAWLCGLPRETGPEVNDNPKTIYCPSTPEELDALVQNDYAMLRANNWESSSD
jgi:prophage regulatory protein